MARPRCARHPNSRVWLDGTYGAPGRKRQRFKCVQPDGSRHVFTLPLPLLLAGEHRQERLDGERPAPQGAGPRFARRFDFTTREVAAALADVGRGLSYRAAGRNVRLRGRDPRLASVSRQANLVADWVEVFAPVVFAAHAPAAWPEAIVVDEAPVSKLAATESGKQIYTILGAAGCDSGNPRLLRLEAYPSASKTAWVEFFAGLAGAPRRIVCGRSQAILAAIPTAWPQPLTPEVTVCHDHLEEQARRLVPARTTLCAVRTLLDGRRTSFRNRERLNRLLLLVHLEQLGLRHEVRYARLIREYLEANGGVAAGRRLILDRKGQPCSLWLP